MNLTGSHPGPSLAKPEMRNSCLKMHVYVPVCNAMFGVSCVPPWIASEYAFQSIPHNTRVSLFRVFSKYDFHNFVFSMKASNPLVMVQAYRLLAAEQYR